MDELLGGNDFFQGGLALMIMGGGLAALRYAPGLIWQVIQRRWAISMTTRDQQLIKWIKVWMSNTEYGQNCKWLDGGIIHESDGMRAVLWPGLGYHTLVEEGKRFYIDHSLEDQGVRGKIELLTLRILGRDATALNRVIEKAVELANMASKGKTSVYINDKWGNWDHIRHFPQRLKNSLFLKRGMIDEILTDAERFFGGQTWYYDRGLPHRRGHLLWGPAGNGKSTIIQVLASELQIPVYLLTLSDPDLTDYGIARAFGQVPDKCLIVVEDFEKIDLKGRQFTISGLLNSIDGSLASEGRLLVVTANDIDTIDDKFLRPGRIDRTWFIDAPEKDAIFVCLSHFGVIGLDKESFTKEAVENNWSMAKVQQQILVLVGPLLMARDAADKAETSLRESFKIVGYGSGSQVEESKPSR